MWIVIHAVPSCFAVSVYGQVDIQLIVCEPVTGDTILGDHLNCYF